MNIGFIKPLDPCETLCMTDDHESSVFAPLPQGLIAEATRDHSLFVLPSRAERAYARDHLLLNPDFYKRVHSVLAYTQRTPERSSYDRDLAVALLRPHEELIAAFLAARAEASAGAHAEGYLRSLAPAFRLLRGLLALWPELLNLLQLPTMPLPMRPEMGRILATSDATWKLSSQFYGGRLNELVAGFDPDLLFIGCFPHNLPFAFGAAKALRAMLPEAQIYLASWEYSLFYSLSHQKSFILAHADDFLRAFDGVVLYQDLAPITMCEVINRVAAGKDCTGLENVLHRAAGAAHFVEPSKTALAGHLESSRLAPMFPYGYLGTRKPEMIYAAPSPAPPVPPMARTRARWRLAQVIPTLQKCYWDKCKFCGINAQNFIDHDPRQAQRGQETADLLIELDRQGYDAALVGREATPAVILEDLVSRLEHEPLALRWSYEGRLEPFLTPRFITRLRDAKCSGATFGLESACERINRLFAKHAPEMTLARITEVLRQFDALGMMVHVNTIIDLPGITTAEVEAHTIWLKARFDELKLFHFNTNMFYVHEGSAVARDASTFGVRARAESRVAFADILDTDWSTTYDYDEGQARPERIGAESLRATWEHVIGAAVFDGLRLDYVHGLYHEATDLAGRDARHGANYLKTMQARLAPLADIGTSVIALASGVEVLAIDASNRSAVLVAGHSRHLPTYVELRPELWAHLARAIATQVPLDEALATLDANERRQVQSAAKDLAASGLLILESRAVAPT